MSISGEMSILRMRVPASLKRLRADRTSAILSVVFLLAAALYMWLAGSTLPLALHGGGEEAYNQLANAFLHLRVSVGNAPHALLALPEPYNPAMNASLQGVGGPLTLGIHDFVLYHGKLLLMWGPAPAIALLVPLHVLGFEPTGSVTVCVFAITGLGFALAILRLILRQIGDVPVPMCTVAAVTVSLASGLPFILTTPTVYSEEIAGGYCFVMAAIWLATSAMVTRNASLRRAGLTSLCFGLAVGSRPTLIFATVLLLAMYLLLRPITDARKLVAALTIPLGVCGLLLLLYNQLRFGSPLENGVRYQLAGLDQLKTRFYDIEYVLPGLWYYVVSPPRIESLFPFVSPLYKMPLRYPGSLPPLYAGQQSEADGLLAIAPILVFAAALPWLWRRRSSALGRLAMPLSLLALAGVCILLLLCYLFFETTIRYEVDFVPLLLLGALASWLALSGIARGWRRRLLQAGGGALAVWSCVVGLAISFGGYYNLIATDHPDTWRTFQDLTSPVSWLIATIEGHPILGEVASAQFPLLNAGEQAHLTIVSPGSRRALLLATWMPTIRRGNYLVASSRPGLVMVHGPGNDASTYRVGPGRETTRIPLRLSAGLDRITVALRSATATAASAGAPASALLVDHLSLEGG